MNKQNTFKDTVLTIFLGLFFMAAILWFIASVVAMLWNFVMPVLGVPSLSPLQALAFYFLIKIIRLDYRRKQEFNINTKMVPDERGPFVEQKPTKNRPSA